jgi:hypothetical protein
MDIASLILVFGGSLQCSLTKNRQQAFSGLRLKQESDDNCGALLGKPSEAKYAVY